MKYTTIKVFITLSLLLITFSLNAQFAGPVGSGGTSAMYKDSSAFINWASMCIVTRGYQDIANTGAGYATVGSDTNGTKKAAVNSVVSLGDGGTAILTFLQPITNGAGFDFAVFENSFNDVFLELAFVEVSSDGINYVRFPATSNTQTLVQIGPFDNLSDATKLNNLAGKYRGMYGTPFDLQELQGQVGLDVNNITHVKVMDVVGTINPPYATYDKDNHAVNDPYPTAFGSGGFDLDAVGVIHQLPVGSQEYLNLEKSIQVYPNPVNDVIFVYTDRVIINHLILTDINGNRVLETTESKIPLSNLVNGFYILNITNSDGLLFTKKIIKN
jgi:hypothetical protein